MKKQLFNSLIMLLLCLAVTGTGTYAWFSSYRLVKSDGIDNELAYNGAVIIDIDVYKYDQETNTVKQYEFTDNPAITAYDSIFLERNVHTPLVFKITMLGEFADSDSIDLILECSSNEASRTARKTSNLIYLKAASKGNITNLSTSSIAEEFNSVVEYFKGISTSKQFLTVQQSGKDWQFVKKDTSVTYPFSLTAAEKSETSKLVEVYMILDYSEELILAHQFQKYGEIEIMQTEVKFDNDFTKLTMNVHYAED